MATLSQIIVPSNVATATNTLTLTNKAIVGGTIDNTPIGATTATTGAFTVATVNGVQFPATQVPSANANQLDDYEEGTFTPTIVGTTTAGTGTYSTQNGRYTKIGNRVCFSLYVVWSAHTGTGNMNVGGLPFTASSGSISSMSIWVSGITLIASNVLTAYGVNGATTIALNQYALGSSAPSAVAMDTNAALMLAGHYDV